MKFNVHGINKGSGYFAGTGYGNIFDIYCHKNLDYFREKQRKKC